MSPTFVTFLLMLGAFLILTVVAALLELWRAVRRRSPADDVPIAREQSTMGDVLLLIAVAMSWYSVAAGWGGQFTLYPIYKDLAAIGPDAFHAFGRGYLSRLGPTLIPLGVMCLAWVLLLWLPCRNVPRATVWAIVGLCVGFVAITPFAATPQRQMQEQGFSEMLYARVMWANGIRTLFFTAIGLLSLGAVRSRWTNTVVR